MRFLIIFLFLFVFGCSGGLNKSEKIYICGDHPCANKNEAEEYFDKNISVEIYTITSDKLKKENFDLVELNMLEDKLRSKNKIEVSKEKKNIKKQIKERKKLAKLKMKRIEETDKSKKLPINKEFTKKKDPVKKKKINKFTFIRICKNLEECDIDKIEKIVMDIGKQKDFPDITN
mgnify:FL=1